MVMHRLVCSDCIVGLLLVLLLEADDIVREKDLPMQDEENANDDAVCLLILISKRSGYWKHLISYISIDGPSCLIEDKSN